MEATSKGIDIGSSALAVLEAFAGDSEEQARAFFKVKGKKLLAAATSKRFAIELEGKADDGSENGEWPVAKRFLGELASVTTDGSPRVPAVIARLLLERTGVRRADLIVKQDGRRHGGHDSDDVLPENRQLTFAQIHKTIDVDFSGGAASSWFPLEKRAHRALAAVYAAALKNTPVSIVSGGDENAPVGFQAQGDGFVMRGILIPPAVQGPGKAVVDEEDADDEEEDEGDKRQGALFAKKDTGVGDGTRHECPGFDGKGCGYTAPAGNKLCPICTTKAGEAAKKKAKEADDDTVIDDEEAERIKAENKPLATEKPARKRRMQKNPKAGSR